MSCLIVFYTLWSPQCREGECSGERDIVLHIPYLEMSDRDQMSSSFTEFHAGFDVVSSGIRQGGFCQSNKVKRCV